mgnify:CR=1 FL=1
MNKRDCVIIGGGSAGLAAAIALKKHDVDVLLLEREDELGGILNQCIHNGFGLTRFKEELTGPSYAERMVQEFHGLNVAYRLHATVTQLNPDKTIHYIDEEGVHIVQAKTVLLAMGARERTRGNIQIPGDRPAGVFTAGVAQRYLNKDGLLVGKRVFILGSGDIGLIMARRLTLAKAKVVGVAEIMPYSNGLTRNLIQCLEDYSIPLYLSTTITQIKGRHQVEAIELSRVDEDLKPIPETAFWLDVDAVLLSVGLIPDNQLSVMAGIEIDPRSKGPKIRANYETSVSGVFASGNVLHIHDVVDYVSEEGDQAAAAILNKLNDHKDQGDERALSTDSSFLYALPHTLNPHKHNKLKYRVRKPMHNVRVCLVCNGRIIYSIKKEHVLPAELEMMIIPQKVLVHCDGACRLEIHNET